MLEALQRATCSDVDPMPGLHGVVRLLQMRVLQAVAKTQGLGAVQSEVAKECGIQAKNFFLLYKASQHWEHASAA